jgi:hypothetical protein
MALWVPPDFLIFNSGRKINVVVVMKPYELIKLRCRNKKESCGLDEFVRLDDNNEIDLPLVKI